MKPENIHINKSSFKYFILYYYTTKYCYIHPNVCFWTKNHLSILQKSYFVFHSRKKYDIWISVHNEQNIYTICILFLFKLPW